MYVSQNIGLIWLLYSVIHPEEMDWKVPSVHYYLMLPRNPTLLPGAMYFHFNRSPFEEDVYLVLCKTSL